MCANQVDLLLSVQHDRNICPESERSVFSLFPVASSLNEILIVTCKLIRARFYTAVLSHEKIFPMTFYQDLGNAYIL